MSMSKNTRVIGLVSLALIVAITIGYLLSAANHAKNSAVAATDGRSDSSGKSTTNTDQLTPNSALINNTLAVWDAPQNEVINVNEQFRSKANCQNFGCLIRLAKQGHGQAQADLGWIFQYGMGTEVDMKLAIDWYQLAALNSNLDAQASLGKAYFDGNGVNQDMDKAFQWSNAAADKGHVKAKVMLAWLHFDGRGTAKSESRAFEIYLDAANKGYDFAQAALGWIYSAGRGAPQDEEKSMFWYKKAAEQGNPDGQLFMGKLLLKGSSIAEKNTEQALEYLQLAANQGNDEARNIMTKIESEATR